MHYLTISYNYTILVGSIVAAAKQGSVVVSKGSKLLTYLLLLIN